MLEAHANVRNQPTMHERVRFTADFRGFFSNEGFGPPIAMEG
jgi:hypothetical protein